MAKSKTRPRYDYTIIITENGDHVVYPKEHHHRACDDFQNKYGGACSIARAMSFEEKERIEKSKEK